MDVMRNKISLLILLAVIPAGILTISCSTKANSHTLIDKVAASNVYVYPLGMTTLTCIASATETERLTYYWSCDDGSFEGASGPVITWRAPNKYGKFHIMVMVDNGKGITDKASMTIEVVVNQNPTQCATCGR